METNPTKSELAVSVNQASFNALISQYKIHLRLFRQTGFACDKITEMQRGIQIFKREHPDISRCTLPHKPKPPEWTGPQKLILFRR